MHLIGTGPSSGALDFILAPPDDPAYIAQDLDFDYFAIGHKYEHDIGRNHASARAFSTNFPEDWQQFYFDNKLQRHDPVIAWGPRVSYAVEWHAICRQSGYNQNQRMVLESASDFGLKCGLFMSVRNLDGSIQLVSFANHRPKKMSESVLAQATRVGQRMSIWLRDKANDGRCSSDEIELSSREIECLRWTALGKTSAEIELIIGISDNTVNFHLKNAMRKLDASSRTLAVVKALRMNLIQL